MSNPSFRQLSTGNGVFFIHNKTAFTVINDGHGFDLPEDGGAFFVFVYTGLVVVNDQYDLTYGMYAVVPGGGSAQASKDTRAVMVQQADYSPMLTIGGPIENKGRLKYIDGCTDSVLLPPIRKGDPCLNFLHFPRGVDQTMHTHPSLRLGMVYSGRGLCVTPFGTVPMLSGQVFAIMPGKDGNTAQGIDGQQYQVGLHRFQTTTEEMRIIAFHETSDFGPTDEDHPMINQTLVRGQVASKVPELLTA